MFTNDSCEYAWVWRYGFGGYLLSCFRVSCPLFGLVDNARCQDVFRYISMYIQLDNVMFPIRMLCTCSILGTR